MIGFSTVEVMQLAVSEIWDWATRSAVYTTNDLVRRRRTCHRQLSEISVFGIDNGIFPQFMFSKRVNRPRFVPVCDLLRSNGAVSACLGQQRLEDALFARVRGSLSPGTRPHCLDARVADRVLTLTLDSPSWATRARYQVPDLLRDLADLRLSDIRVRARPEPEPPLRPTRMQRLRLTAAVVDHLLAASHGCADPRIGEIFRRLAGRRGAQGPGGAKV